MPFTIPKTWTASISTTLTMVLCLLALLSAPASAQERAVTDGGGAPAEGKAPGFFFWTDTSLSLLPYGWGFAVDPEERSVMTVEHAHASKIGDMFMFVDFTWFHGDDEDEETTWYGEIGPRFSFGKLLGKDLSFNLFKRSLFEFKDVLFAMQYERGEHPDVAEAVLLGLGVDLDVRKLGLLGALGKFNYIQLNLYARAELTKDTPDGFRDMQVTMAASYPFTIGKSAFLIDGYFDWVLGLGDEDWSYHLNPQLTMDLGAFWKMPQKLYVGIEIDLWWNKYQIPDTSAFDTNQTAVSLLVKYHVF